VTDFLDFGERTGTAEEWLATLTGIASNYWEPPIEETLELANEAITLLRRLQRWNAEGDFVDTGTGERVDTEVEILDDIDAFLDGEKP